MKDAEILSLDMEIISDFIFQDEDVEDDMDDDELFSLINAKRSFNL